jgi:putative flippase GtrA
MKFIKLQGIKYLVSGGLNTIITYALYLLLLLVAEYRVAFSVTFVVGIFISYCMNAYFVFNVKLTYKGFFSYHLIYIFQYFTGLLLMVVFVDILNIDQRVAPILNVFILTPISYLATIVFFKNHRPSP